MRVTLRPEVHRNSFPAPTLGRASRAPSTAPMGNLVVRKLDLALLYGKVKLDAGDFMSTTEPSKKRGSSTPDRIIAAARSLFLERGYRETSLDDVAADAGVTKPTVYSHFQSKEGLLLAMVEAHVTENARVLSTSLTSSGDPRADLHNFGTVFLSRLLNKDATCWRRLAMAEAREHPEIGKAVFAAGPARVLKAIAGFLKQETESGRLACDDPALAAEQFVGMLMGINPIRESAGQPIPGPAKQAQICSAAVSTFMAAFGAPASDEESI